MQPNAGENATLLVGGLEAAEIVGGMDALNEHITAGRLKPIRLNDRPGAASMFRRSLLERLARRACRATMRQFLF